MDIITSETTENETGKRSKDIPDNNLPVKIDLVPKNIPSARNKTWYKKMAERMGETYIS